MTKYRSLPYYGGKRGYGKAEWIASLLPWSRNSCYVEPCGGMAGVLLARPPVKIEILNDLDERVINWWRAVRDCPEEFGRLVELTPRSRAEFRWACQAAGDVSLPPLRRALAFHIATVQRVLSCNHGTGGTWRRVFTPEVGGLGNFTRLEIETLATRLWNVEFDQTDANTLLARIASLDYAVVYVDPPYPQANTSAYQSDTVDYPRMAELLAGQAGAVAVSGYGDEWDMLGWDKQTRPALFRRVTTINRQSNGEPRTEVLWRNPRCVADAAAQLQLNGGIFG